MCKWTLREAVAVSANSIRLLGWVEFECAHHLQRLRDDRPLREQVTCGWISTAGGVTGRVIQVGTIASLHLARNKGSVKTVPFVLLCSASGLGKDHDGRAASLPPLDANAYVRLPRTLISSSAAGSFPTSLSAPFSPRARSFSANNAGGRGTRETHVRMCTSVDQSVSSSYAVTYMRHLEHLGFNDVVVYGLEPLGAGLKAAIRAERSVTFHQWSLAPLPSGSANAMSTHHASRKRMPVPKMLTEVHSRLLASRLHCLADAISTGVDWMMAIDLHELPHLGPGSGQRTSTFQQTLQQALLTTAPPTTRAFVFQQVPHTADCFDAGLRPRSRPCLSQWGQAERSAANLTLQRLIHSSFQGEQGSLSSLGLEAHSWRQLYRPLSSMLTVDFHGPLRRATSSSPTPKLAAVSTPTHPLRELGRGMVQGTGTGGKHGRAPPRGGATLLASTFLLPPSIAYIQSTTQQTGRHLCDQAVPDARNHSCSAIPRPLIP